MTRQVLHRLVACLLLGISSGSMIYSTSFESILDYGTSAYSISVGNMMNAEKTPSALYQNPASMEELGVFSASSMMTYMAGNEVQYYSFILGRSWKSYELAAGVLTLKSKDIKHTGADADDRFYTKDSFRYLQSVYRAGVKRRFDRWSLGIAGSYTYHPLYNVYGRSINLDLGAIVPMGADSELSLLIRDALIFSPIRYTQGDAEPTQTTLFVTSKTSMKSAQYFTQFQLKRSKSPLFGLGVRYRPKGIPFLYLSAGWQQFHVLQIRHTKPTFGIGVDFDVIGVDVAYEPSEFAKTTSQFYLTFNMKLK